MLAISHELLVLGLALLVLLADLWLPPKARQSLGLIAAAGVGLILLFSLFGFSLPHQGPEFAFNGMYALDPLALFFKRFFLLAALVVLVLANEFSDRIQTGGTEFYALILFALSGMLFASSANDFSLLFVSLELVTLSFYVLTSFQRSRQRSLEAGVKYLIMGALSTGFTVFGIALVYGISTRLNFAEVAAVAGNFANDKLFLLGLLFVVIGLAFKIAAFPFQIWAPDVYEGSPTPATAFLAIGSKATGFVLLLRVLFTAVPEITARWSPLLIVISSVTILYGNLCALPQRNVKRLLGYSSIAQAGYVLLGIAAGSVAGQSAVLYFLSAYLFTVLGAFAVICIVMRHLESEDVSALNGLYRRSPLLAAAMALAMISLAGIPPLAGFFGKFLLLKAALEQAAHQHAFYAVSFIAAFGVVISLYYYFGIIRAMYWPAPDIEQPPIVATCLAKAAVAVCVAGMLYLGLFPNSLLNASVTAVHSLTAHTEAPAPGVAGTAAR